MFNELIVKPRFLSRSDLIRRYFNVIVCDINRAIKSFYWSRALDTTKEICSLNAKKGHVYFYLSAVTLLEMRRRFRQTRFFRRYKNL